MEREWRKNYLMHGQASQDSPYWTKGHRKDTLVRFETYKKTNNLSSRWCMARYVDAYVWCSEKVSKTKMGYRVTKARQCQTIERNILHRTRRWRVQAHSESRSEKVGSSDPSSNALQNTDKEQESNPAAILGNARQNMLVLLMPTKARDQGQKELYTNITKIISLKKGWFLCCSQIHSDALSNEKSRRKGSSGKNMGKTGENSGRAADESQKQERGDRGSKDSGKTSSFRVIDGSLTS